MKMRVLTNKEWDKLCSVVHCDDAIMHYTNIHTLVLDQDWEPAIYAVRGYFTFNVWDTVPPTHRSAYSGFRPAVEMSAEDDLPSDVKEGDIVILGTLYMDETPVHVPQKPACDGDIQSYVPGSKLELRKVPVTDDNVQMTGIYIGNGVVITDRVMLKCISHEDIEQTAPYVEDKSEVSAESETARLIRKLDEIAQKHPDKIRPAMIGWYFVTEEYSSKSKLNLEQLADLATLLVEINVSDMADERFSTYDYADALVHTIYDINVAKLIELGKKDFDSFCDAVTLITEQKRAVYELVDYDDTDLLHRIRDELGL